MDSITWPIAVSIIGTLVVLAGFLITLFKKDTTPWSADLQQSEDDLATSIREVEHRTTVSEGKQKEIFRRLDELKSDLKDLSDNNDKKNDKLEEKLDNITQLVFELLRNSK